MAQLQDSVEDDWDMGHPNQFPCVDQWPFILEKALCLLLETQILLVWPGHPQNPKPLPVLSAPMKEIGLPFPAPGSDCFTTHTILSHSLCGDGKGLGLSSRVLCHLLCAWKQRAYKEENISLWNAINSNIKKGGSSCTCFFKKEESSTPSSFIFKSTFQSMICTTGKLRTHLSPKGREKPPQARKGLGVEMIAAWQCSLVWIFSPKWSDWTPTLTKIRRVLTALPYPF